MLRSEVFNLEASGTPWSAIDEMHADLLSLLQKLAGNQVPVEATEAPVNVERQPAPADPPASWHISAL